MRQTHSERQSAGLGTPHLDSCQKEVCVLVGEDRWAAGLHDRDDVEEEVQPHALGGGPVAHQHHHHVAHTLTR